MSAHISNKSAKNFRKFLLLEAFVLLASILLLYMAYVSHINQKEQLEWPMAVARVSNWKIQSAGKYPAVVLSGTVFTPAGSYPFNLRWGSAEYKENQGWVPKKDLPKIGDFLTVRYNPARPFEVVLKNVPTLKFLLLSLSAGLFFIAITLYLARFKPHFLRMNRHDRKRLKRNK